MRHTQRVRREAARRGMKPKQYDSCTQIRRKLLTHSTLNLNTGETSNERQEWVTEPCNAPLFGDLDRTSGKCRSCATGWTHPHNFPVDTLA